ncbi:MAG: FtsH protease activity modulator HflK [Bacillota bacterium]
MRAIRNGFLGVLLVALLVNLALTSWFKVEEHEEALVLTMGRATRQVDKGVHGKLPWPIETVVTRPVRIVKQLTFGYREKGGKLELVPDEALMITGDENIVWADLLVEWKIADIGRYEFASEDPERLLLHATSAALRSVMGTTSLDYAITTGKFEIQAEVQRQLTALMDRYDVGIRVESVKLQDVEPPTEVSPQFKAVTDAREAKQTKINEAGKYEAERIPKARGEAQQLLEQAAANKQARINQALGDVAKYKAIYEAYTANPQVTRKRLILETLEAILPGAEITIVEANGDTVKYLPISPRKEVGR